MNTNEKISKILHDGFSDQFFKFEALNFLSIMEEYVSKETREYLDLHVNEVIELLSKATEERLCELYSEIFTDEEIDKLFILLNDPLLKRFNEKVSISRTNQVGIEITASALQKVADFLPSHMTKDKKNLEETLSLLFQNCN